MQARLLPRQMQFLRSNAKECLYSGSFGAGKSRGLCYKLLTHAVIPGNLVGFCRAERSALKATTMRTLLLPDGDLPPVLPKGTYSLNRDLSIIQLHGGGEIYFFGFEDWKRIGSLNLGAVGVDEGVELNEDQYTMLIGRIRNTVDPHRQLFIATNPDSPMHYLYKRFFSERAGEVIETNSFDNWHLPEDYLETLRSLKGTAYQRYALGKWVVSEGVIFGELQRIEREGPWQHTIIGIDPGFHEAAVIWLGIPAYGQPHVLKELRLCKKTEAELVSALLEVYQGEPVVCDPSSPSTITALQEAGIEASAGDNSVLAGINKVLELNPTVEPSCTELLKEGATYAWQAGEKDKPVKAFDHGPDALRYTCMAVEGATADYSAVLA